MLRISVEASLEPAVEALRAGGVICYPTETFYALGADPWNEAACSRLRELKRRPGDKDLPLIVASADMIAHFCDTADPRFAVLAKRFWPGPLTLVLPALHGGGSYAVRVSSASPARRLSAMLGGPIVSTSANLSGEPPVSDPTLLNASVREGVDVLIDGGRCPGGLPSTIVSLLTRPASIVREGAVPPPEILEIL